MLKKLFECTRKRIEYEVFANKNDAVKGLNCFQKSRKNDKRISCSQVVKNVYKAKAWNIVWRLKIDRMDEFEMDRKEELSRTSFL